MVETAFGKIALGCVTFGREIDETMSFRVLDHAFERGIRLFDTAESYGARHSSEKILGWWLRRTGVRKDVVVQTKVSAGFRPEQVCRSLEGSRERLRVDRIDVYLLHRFDAHIPLSDTMAPIADAIAAGQVGVAGCSNFDAATLSRALALARDGRIPRFETVQPPYNLLQREIEAELLPLCARERVTVIPYSPLAAGFLTGKYTADRERIPAQSRFEVIPGHADIYFSERNFAMVERLRALADRTRLPMARLALAWALKNSDIAAVLIGARSTQHIDNAFEALAMEFPAEWDSQL